MRSGIDFGMVALLVIQISAVMGSVFVLLRMRAEVDRIASEKSWAKEEFSRVDVFAKQQAAILQEFREKLIRVSADFDDAAKAADKAATMASQAIEHCSDNAAAIRSVRASVAAQARYKPQPPDGEGGGEPEETTPRIGYPPPPPQSRLRDDFGKSVV